MFRKYHRQQCEVVCIPELLCIYGNRSIFDVMVSQHKNEKHSSGFTSSVTIFIADYIDKLQ